MVLYAHQKLNLNVISVEDPVEQILNGITQISVNEKAGINYESSFKAILRCDPDVILIGEIRDSTVAKYVIQASLSGHLVLSTMRMIARSTITIIRNGYFCPRVVPGNQFNF